MTAGEFTVWEFYPDGTGSAVATDVGAKEAVGIAERTTRKPAVLLGVIVEVRITDGGDNCVFQWKNGEGVTYPPRADGSGGPTAADGPRSEGEAE
jgi:hypothetical protein